VIPLPIIPRRILFAYSSKTYVEERTAQPAAARIVFDNNVDLILQREKYMQNYSGCRCLLSLRFRLLLPAPDWHAAVVATIRILPKHRFLVQSVKNNNNGHHVGVACLNSSGHGGPGNASRPHFTLAEKPFTKVSGNNNPDIDIQVVVNSKVVKDTPLINLNHF